MTVGRVPASSEWLTLREPADAAARATDFVEEIRSYLSSDGAAVIHDLGCGTGSMARWLAVQLDGPQHRVMHDGDVELRAVAAADPPRHAADGAVVTVETRRHDITRLEPTDLALITASALLDMLTTEELDRLLATCADASCPVLITLSVTGRVDLSPADPFDERVSAAFNDHQRRIVGNEGCSAQTHSALQWTASPDWASMSRSDRAHGASVRPRPISRRPGSSVG